MGRISKGRIVLNKGEPLRIVIYDYQEGMDLRRAVVARKISEEKAWLLFNDACDAIKNIENGKGFGFPLRLSRFGNGVLSNLVYNHSNGTVVFTDHNLLYPNWL